MVDDEDLIRQMLRDALEDDGYAVREAADGRDALADTQTWRPDVILLDLIMPVMNGWQFAEEYRKLPGPHAPVVAMTAAQPGAARAAMEIGAENVLLKPLYLPHLLELIASLVGAR